MSTVTFTWGEKVMEDSEIYSFMIKKFRRWTGKISIKWK
jgi:hypothetical protein